MNRILQFVSIAVFSIFLGSQITEGILLVPYWKSLSSAEFYSYYASFGSRIGSFYSTLTIIAVLIPVGLSIHCFSKKSPALKYALVSTFFALLIIAIFYGYFKGTNQLFYQAAFNAKKLKVVLDTWEYMHWVRVFFELMSLVFLMVSFKIISAKKSTLIA